MFLFCFLYFYCLVSALLVGILETTPTHSEYLHMRSHTPLQHPFLQWFLCLTTEMTSLCKTHESKITFLLGIFILINISIISWTYYGLLHLLYYLFKWLLKLVVTI